MREVELMGAELFTIVIPTYNRAHTVIRSINSAIGQTYENIEVLVVDDGSNDDTKKLLDQEIRDDRVQYVYRKHKGAQHARNFGLSIANGEYIIFLDSDDEILPTCLEEMVDQYRSDKEVNAVYVLTGLRRKDGTICLARNDVLEGHVYKEILDQGYLTSTSFISMRRSVFERIGTWDVLLPSSQDDDMCFRIAKNYKVALVKKILGIYGVDSGNQIGNAKERVADGWWMLWQKYEKDVFELCGREAVIKHFRECAERFKDNSMMEKYYEVTDRVEELLKGNHGE